MWFAELSCWVPSSFYYVRLGGDLSPGAIQSTPGPRLQAFLTRRARNAWRPSVRHGRRERDLQEGLCLRGFASPADLAPCAGWFAATGVRRMRDRNPRARAILWRQESARE